MLEHELFLDAAYLIALAVPADEHHGRARELMEETGRSSCSIITTRPVLLEVGDALSKPQHRSGANRLLAAVENDPRIEVVPLTDDLYARGLALFRERPDKSWGLTDCISFLVMEERRLRQALTTDEHFEQAGFTALLRS